MSSIWTKAGLAAGGLVAGVVLAGTLGASAATTTTTTPTAPSDTQSGTGTPPPPGFGGLPWCHPGGPHARGKTGSITAVGGASVTIKDSAGATTTYAVTSASDIDKNGEATLADLKPGDAVRFSTDSSGKTIDRLHAGDEAKDRPTGAPMGGPGAAPGVQPPGSSSGA